MIYAWPILGRQCGVPPAPSWARQPPKDAGANCANAQGQVAAMQGKMENGYKTWRYNRKIPGGFICWKSFQYKLLTSYWHLLTNVSATPLTGTEMSLKYFECLETITETHTPQNLVWLNVCSQNQWWSRCPHPFKLSCGIIRVRSNVKTHWLVCRLDPQKLNQAGFAWNSPHCL